MKLNVAARMGELPVYLFGKLNALKYEKRRKGLDIIYLGMGNPLDPTPKPIVDKLCHAVQQGSHRICPPDALRTQPAQRALPQFWQ